MKFFFGFAVITKKKKSLPPSKGFSFYLPHPFLSYSTLPKATTKAIMTDYEEADTHRADEYREG